MFFALLNFFFMFSHITWENSFPKPLTPEEEQFYISRYEKGDIDARNILIERNLRLVAHIAKKYPNISKESEDYISIGTIGLIKAISTFDSSKGNRLATYAARCIENEILMAMRAAKKHINDVYLQDTIGTDKDGNEITLQDKVADENADVEEKVNLKMQIEKLKEKIKTVLKGRERLIIELRYALLTGEEVTQREIARKLGISRSYVSKIEKKALMKLNEEMNK